MAFPQTPLPIQVELSLGGVWTDITTDVYSRDLIRITRGRADEGRQVDAGRCTITLDNRAGKYSPRNPTGPYYGQLGRNTPVRVSVAAGTPYMKIADTSGDRASTPDDAALDITGDIDMRIEVTLDDWVSSALGTNLIGKYNLSGNQRSYRLVTQNSYLFLGWSTAGTDLVERTSTVPLVIPPSRRLAVRATLDVDNGASGHTVTFYSAPSIAGPWTQLGDPVVTAGTTSIFSGTAPLDVGQIQNLGFLAPAGQIHAAQVRSGIAGSTVADPDFTAQTVGATSFVDSAGRTWTLADNASISNQKVRFVGEVPAWPLDADSSGRDIYTQIQAAGILRRLGQGASPLASTLRRRIPSGSGLIAYWPMEDAAGSTQAYSPIAGVAPIRPTGFSWASSEGPSGSSALPQLGASASFLARPPRSALTTWHVEMVYNLPTLPASSETMIRVDLASGTIAYLLFKVGPTQTTMEFYDRNNALLINNTYAPGISYVAGVWNRLQIFNYVTGGNAYATAAWRDIVTGNWNYHQLFYAGTWGPISSISGSWGSSWQGMAIGHLAVFTTPASSSTVPGQFIYESADDGFSGETAGARMLRLAGEESNPVLVYGATSLQERMGPQRPNTFLTLLQEAADSDHGILYEERGAAKLAYRDRISLYNQTATATLNYPTTGHLRPPLMPVDDDQQVRNDITVQRINGSSGRVTLDTGVLSTAAPPSGVGRYTDSLQLSLYTDDQPYMHAGWLLHLGTVDEPRYPVVNLSLQAATSLIDTVAALDCGARLQITNPASRFAPGTIDLLVQGYTETLSQYQWDLALNCVPASPYTVAVADDTTLGHADTDGSKLASGVNSSATSLSVAITSGPLWSTADGDYPVDILVAGERMTVTAVSGGSSPQTFTVTRSVNGVVKAQSADAPVALYQPAITAL